MKFSCFTWLFYFIVIDLIYLSHESKILGIFPTTSKSHGILGGALLKGLAERGHEVTMFSNFPLKSPIKNYRDLTYKKDMLAEFHAHLPNLTIFEKDNTMSIKKMFQILNFGTHLCDTALNDMQDLLYSNETFDAVIVHSLMTESLYAIAAHFKAPLIVFSGAGTSTLTNSLVGNPQHYAYTQDVLLGYPDKMTFLQRVITTVVNIIADLWKSLYHLPKHEAIRAKYFPNLPDLYTIMSNTSLLLINTHNSIAYPRPNVPNLIEIGGYHVPDAKPLPTDLKKYLDEAKNGVIYFSLGSNAQSKDMPIEMKNAILKVFSELKETVLWKWEEEVLPGKPDNVKIRKWFPQTDILAHPNVKLFITHGGWGSITESIQRGVPILGIPLLGDQGTNVKLAETRGFGIGLQWTNITYASLSWALNELLTNRGYSNAMKETSQLFNDREMKPMDRAIYWIEYVIRNKGAKHLRSAALDLNRAQLLLLDVILFLGSIITSVCFIFYFCIKMLCKKCTKVKIVKNKKNN